MGFESRSLRQIFLMCWPNLRFDLERSGVFTNHLWDKCQKGRKSKKFLVLYKRQRTRANLIFFLQKQSGIKWLIWVGNCRRVNIKNFLKNRRCKLVSLIWWAIERECKNAEVRSCLPKFVWHACCGSSIKKSYRKKARHQKRKHFKELLSLCSMSLV